MSTLESAHLRPDPRGQVVGISLIFEAHESNECPSCENEISLDNETKPRANG
jgi:hypothetical protein